MGEDTLRNEQWLAKTKTFRDDVPSGPGASWSEQDHRQAKALSLKCHSVFGSMAMADPGVPDRHKAAFSRWMGDMAIAHVLPDDYPGFRELVSSIRKQFEALKPFVARPPG